MESIIDLSRGRKARHEREEYFRDAAKTLLLMLEGQRQYLTEDFMTFLMAMAVSDQALAYAEEAGNKKAGLAFIEHLLTTTQQIFETSYPDHRNLTRVATNVADSAPSCGGIGNSPRIIEFVSRQPMSST